MKVINVDRVFDHLVAKLIRFAVSSSGFYSPTRHTNGHGMGIVVATGLECSNLRDR